MLKKSFNFYLVLPFVFISLLLNQAWAQDTDSDYSNLNDLIPQLNQDNNSTSNIHAVLKPLYEAKLSSQIVGVVKKINLLEGDNFKKDDTLILLDCTVNKAFLQKAQAQLKMRQSEHQANSRLSKLNAISGIEVQKSRALVEEAKADIIMRKKTVNDCDIKAPFDGQVIDIEVNQFETVSQGQSLINILDNRSLYIELIIPSSWLSWLKVDDTFDLQIKETNKSYPASIKKIIPNVDAVSQSVEVRGEIVGEYEELLAGMSGKAHFPQKP